MKRKLLSLTLVLALVLSMVPMGAFAAAGALTNTAYGDTTQVVGDVQTSVNITAQAVTPVPIGGTINVTFPATYKISSTLTAGAVTITGAGLGAGVAPSDVTVSGQTVAVKTANLLATSAAFNVAIAGSNITNGTVIGAQSITVVTKDASGNVIDEKTFAGSTLTTTGFDRNTSSITVTDNKTSVTADGTSYVEYTVLAKDKYYNTVKTGKIYYSTSRPTTDSVTILEGTAAAAMTGTTAGAITVSSEGQIKIRVFSNAAGTSKVVFGFGDGSNVDPGVAATKNYFSQYANGTSDSVVNANNLNVIGTKDLTFSADSAGKFSVDTTITSHNTQNYGIKVDSATTPVTYTVGDVKTDGTTLLSTATELANKVKSNGTDYYKVTVRLVTNNNVPVSGQTVKFDSSDSAVTFDSSSVTTDGSGAATVKVYSTKNGVVTINAKAGSVNSEKNFTLQLKFAPNGVNSIELSTADNAVIAKDEDKSIKFRLFDSQGNQIKLSEDTATGQTLLDKHKITFVAQKEPSGSNIESGVTSTFVTDSKDRLVCKIKPKYEGEYIFRVKLDNGKKADFTFTVKKQGEVKDLDFYYDEKIVPINKTASSLTLDRLDAAKVAVDGTNSLSEFYFTSSDNTIATVDTKGVVSMKPGNNQENVGKQVTVTATDKVNKLSKSYTFTVGGEVANLLATPPKAAAVGKDAEVLVQFADKNGKAVGFTIDSLDTWKTEYVVVSKPDGATIGSSLNDGAFKADIQTTGGTWKFTSNKAGEVKIQLIVKHKVAATGVETSYTTVVPVTFGEAATVASKTLVLNMGSTTGFMNNGAVKSDLAPFIKDGRAFVPVSFIAAQLGGTAEFTKNAAGLVDTVTVKAGTTTVTMTIGSTTIKVVKDGKESTVTSDVAPFIKSGRTVLPFRAIAEAMGAKVSFGPETGAVEWVKFEM